MELVETWLSSGPLLESLWLKIKLVSRCPLRLGRKSEPFCFNGERMPLLVAQNLETNKTEQICITVPILAASLAAEFLLMLTVLLIAIVVTLMILSRRDRK